MIGSGPAEKYHMRWFEQHMPPSRRSRRGVLRMKLRRPVDRRAEIARAAAEADRRGSFRRRLPVHGHPAMDVGTVPALVSRVTYTGDLGYEIWVAPEYQRALFDLIRAAGEGARHRQFRHARAELACGWRRTSPPGPASSARSTAPSRPGSTASSISKKNDFIGRDGAAAEKESGGKLRLVVFIVDAGDADVIGDEPIWHNGKVVGWVTSGGYAHWSKESMALGYVPKELAGETIRLRDRDHRRTAQGDADRRAAVRSRRRQDAGVTCRPRQGVAYGKRVDHVGW